MSYSLAFVRFAASASQWSHQVSAGGDHRGVHGQTARTNHQLDRQENVDGKVNLDKYTADFRWLTQAK